MAGPDGNFSAGSEIDVSEKKAVELVDGGYADYAGPVETAVIEPVKETATIPKKRKQRKQKNARKLESNNRTGK